MPGSAVRNEGRDHFQKKAVYMFIQVHAAETMLRGDGSGYNPREIRATLLPDGIELISGVFRDDGVGSTNRADRPFRNSRPRDSRRGSISTASIFSALHSSASEIVISY